MVNKKTLPLIYALGLPILLIVSSYIARINFKVFGSPLSLCVFIYPLTYLISCKIVKRTGLKYSLMLMAIALILDALGFVIQWILVDSMDCWVMICSYISFLLSQLILIYTYDFLLKTKKDTYIPIFLLILVISIIDNALFGTFIEGQLISLSILIRLIYAVALPVVIARKDSK